MRARQRIRTLGAIDDVCIIADTAAGQFGTYVNSRSRL